MILEKQSFRISREDNGEYEIKMSAGSRIDRGTAALDVAGWIRHMTRQAWLADEVRAAIRRDGKLTDEQIAEFERRSREL